MEDNRWAKETLEEFVGGIVSELLNKFTNTIWDDLTFAEYAKGVARKVATDLYAKNENYKYSVVCTFAKKNQVAPKVESVCMWDVENDVHVSVCQDTYYLFCILNVSAICLDK